MRTIIVSPAGWTLAAATVLMFGAGALSAEDQAAAPAPSRLKVTQTGDVFLDGQPVAISELTARLEQLKQAGGRIIYYREQPQTAASPKAAAVLQDVLASQIPMDLGDRGPSEWGELELFEVEISPKIFRLAVMKGSETLVGLPPGPDVPSGVVIYGKLPPDTERAVLEALDALISADRIIETPEASSDKAFIPETLETQSVHVRCSYRSGRKWRSWYAKGHVPPNVDSLLQDAYQMAQKIATYEQARRSKDKAAESAGTPAVGAPSPSPAAP